MGSPEVHDLCGCGRRLTPSTLELTARRGAVADIAGVVQPIMRRRGAGRVVAVFDQTTAELFADAVLTALQRHDVPVKPLTLGASGQVFEPDEAAVAMVDEAVRDGDPLLIGVGSGAINDLCKHVSARRTVPYVSVATAPSMDGFAAPISAIIVDRVKTTVPSRSPDAVVADLDILAGAPEALVSAGFADVLGKLTSLVDWRLAHIFFDEYWCEATAEQVGSLAERVAGQAEAIGRREPAAVGTLMEALVHAGTSVIHVGSSRPTSAAEHLISHFFEMWRINREERPPLHGHAVGLGTIVACRIAESLRTHDAFPGAHTDPDPIPEQDDVLAALRIDHVPDNFGKTKFDKSIARRRTAVLTRRWSDALQVLRTLPSAADVERLLKAAGCPIRFADIGFDGDSVRKALLWARYVRERYTLLDLAHDAGLLGAVADGILETYA